LAEARAHLNDVTNAAFAGTRHRLERNLAEDENAATNPAAGISTNVAAAPTKLPAVPINAVPDPVNASHRTP
jgi:hypothetical protein